MKKSNGYTLVELLAIISIIGAVIILFIPMMLNSLGNAKKMLGEYDLEGLEDAGKMYVTDLDNGIKTYTYKGTSDISINGKTIKPNTELSGYDLKVYLIQKGPIDVTAEFLVSEGYYDENCKYATKAGEKDRNCHAPKNCTLSVGLDYTLTKDKVYYVTTGYTAKIKSGCE